MNEIIKRNSLGHPLRGQPSLNAGGRPVGRVRQVRELLGFHTAEFVDELLRLLRSDDERVRLAAVREGLDRLLGRAPLSLDDSEAEARAAETIQRFYLQALELANHPSDPIDVTPQAASAENPASDDKPVTHATDQSENVPTEDEW
jgi:hypothetical protein